MTARQPQLGLWIVETALVRSVEAAANDRAAAPNWASG